ACRLATSFNRSCAMGWFVDSFLGIYPAIFPCGSLDKRLDRQCEFLALNSRRVASYGWDYRICPVATCVAWQRAQAGVDYDERSSCLCGCCRVLGKQ